MNAEIRVFNWIVAIGLGFLICLGTGVAITWVRSKSRIGTEDLRLALAEPDGILHLIPEATMTKAHAMWKRQRKRELH